MITLYNQIIDRLSAVPQLSMIDYDNGQLEVPDFPLTLPSLLFDIPNITHKTLGAGYQQNDMEIHIRIAFPWMGTTYSISQLLLLTERQAVLNRVNALLHLWQPENCGKMTRIQTVSEPMPPEATQADPKVYRIVYQVSQIENVNNTLKEVTIENIEITPSITQ